MSNRMTEVPEERRRVEEGGRYRNLEAATPVSTSLRTQCAINGSRRICGLSKPRTTRNVKPGVFVFWYAHAYVMRTYSPECVEQNTRKFAQQPQSYAAWVSYAQIELSSLRVGFHLLPVLR